MNIPQRLFIENEKKIIPDNFLKEYQSLLTTSDINTLPNNNSRDLFPAFMQQANLSTWYQRNADRLIKKNDDSIA